MSIGHSWFAGVKLVSMLILIFNEHALIVPHAGGSWCEKWKLTKQRLKVKLTTLSLISFQLIFFTSYLFKYKVSHLRVCILPSSQCCLYIMAQVDANLGRRVPTKKTGGGGGTVSPPPLSNNFTAGIPLITKLEKPYRGTSFHTAVEHMSVISQTS